MVAWVSGQWVPASEAGFDHEQVAVFVWRAERAGGDTKTPESPADAGAASPVLMGGVAEHRVRQAEDRLAAGPLWQDHGLVFALAVPLRAAKSRLAVPAHDFIPIARADRA